LGWAGAALQLNPIYPEYYTGYLGGIHFLNSDYPEAIRTVEKCPDVIPYLAIWKAASYALMGRQGEAERAYEEFRALMSAVWVGKAAPTDEDLDQWILDILPIYWSEGKARLASAIRLAREKAREPKALV
jgi:hypothetical protein